MSETIKVESVLTDAERAIVLAYINTPVFERNKAHLRPLYVSALSRGATPQNRKDDLHLQYLSELFNPAPDLGIRHSLAERIKAASNGG